MYSTARDSQASVNRFRRLIETLVRQGLIRLNEKETNEKKLPRYELTDDGREFRRATAATPVHREKAVRPLRDSWSGFVLSMTMIAFFTKSRL
ncbi:hypothetical protein RBB77_01405 [Tunturibacter psychrotolerans]|uniref:HTH hxlR-type domain-containing protein n=1 Tax=Tunturiibacter psychrotolerans TaxID=3069686 RepID=A0AAU7ZRI6_9BACT